MTQFSFKCDTQLRWPPLAANLNFPETVVNETKSASGVEERGEERGDLEEDESFSLHPTLFPTLFHSGGICCTSPKLDILGKPVILYPWLPPIVPEPKEIELDSRALLRAN